MFHLTAKSSPVVSGLCQQCSIGSSRSIPWAVECIFWSAWPLPLMTRGLTGCRVTAESLPLLQLTSHFRHILDVSVGSFRVSCDRSYSKTRGWAVEMPSQGVDLPCWAWDLCTGTAACLWLCLAPCEIAVQDFCREVLKM